MEGSGLCDAYTAVFPSYILPSLLRAGMVVLWWLIESRILALYYLFVLKIQVLKDCHWQVSFFNDLAALQLLAWIFTCWYIEMFQYISVVLFPGQVELNLICTFRIIHTVLKLPQCLPGFVVLFIKKKKVGLRCLLDVWILWNAKYFMW